MEFLPRDITSWLLFSHLSSLVNLISVKIDGKEIVLWIMFSFSRFAILILNKIFSLKKDELDETYLKPWFLFALIIALLSIKNISISYVRIHQLSFLVEMILKNQITSMYSIGFYQWQLSKKKKFLFCLFSFKYSRTVFPTPV
jgi:hypothetical protein